MPFPNDLLEQAYHLASREPKRPKQASLRRAVSTAYYALFHLLSSETAKNWRRPAERSTLARMFEHGSMARVCFRKCDELNTYFETRPAEGRELTVLRHILLIASTFVRMRQYRELADYDSSAKWTRDAVAEGAEESGREISRRTGGGVSGSVSPSFT